MPAVVHKWSNTGSLSNVTCIQMNEAEFSALNSMNRNEGKVSARLLLLIPVN